MESGRAADGGQEGAGGAPVSGRPRPARRARTPGAGPPPGAGAHGPSLAATGSAPDIRDATREDVRAIQRVARRSWPATYAGLLTDAEITHFLRWGYNLAQLRADVGAAGRGRGHFLVAERGGEVVAYLHWLPDGRHGPELRRLYVDPDHLGAGIGTALLRALHRRLEPGTAYVLRVHPDNRRALDFYRGRGFEWAGRAGSPPHESCVAVLRTTVPAERAREPAR